LALRPDRAGDVMLSDVRHFVRHDTRQLRFAARLDNQSGIDTDEAAG
jgi:hypothetical protein